MADEKKQEKVEMTDAEKFRLWRKRAIIGGRVVAITAGLAGAAFIGYRIGHDHGYNGALEEVYKQLPEVRESLTTLDPAFFASIKL